MPLLLLPWQALTLLYGSVISGRRFAVAGISGVCILLAVAKVAVVGNHDHASALVALLVRVGTGLSPVKGVVDYFAANPTEAVSTTLIAGFKSPEDVLFKEDFKLWKEKLEVIQTVDQAPEGYEGPVGMVTKYIPDLQIKDIENSAFICVGPPIMIKFTVMEILKLGVLEKNIWISHERKMCCGIGKCGHCKIGSTYVCLDGPVFNYTVGKDLID